MSFLDSDTSDGESAVLEVSDPTKQEVADLRYARLAEIGVGVAETVAKVTLARYDSVLEEIGDKRIFGALTGARAKSWLDVVGDKGATLATAVAALWVAHHVTKQKSRRGDPDARREVDRAIMGLCHAGLTVLNPAAGMLVTLMLSLAKAIEGARSFSTATETMYRAIWDQVSKKLEGELPARTLDIDARGIDLADAYNDHADLTDRIGALHFIINSGKTSRDAPEPLRTLFWDVTRAPVGELEGVCRRHGFSEREIAFLRGPG